MSRRTVLGFAAFTTLAAGVVAVAALVTGTVDTPEPYVVQKGDTLFVIARDHGVTVDQLREWNDIDGDLIEVGQLLWTWSPDGGARPTPGAARPDRPVAVGAVGSAGRAPREGLQRPRPKRCLGGPTDVEGDMGFAASEGLSYEEASSSMNRFVHHVLPCIGGDAQPAETLRLEITVACSGVVDGVEVLDAGDWPPSVAACVSDTLEYAEFPAHGLPDGDSFEYPLKFTPG